MIALVHLEKSADGYYFYTGSTVFRASVTVKKFMLIGGSDAATAVWKKDGSSGTVMMTLKAPAGETVIMAANDNEGWHFPYNSNGSVYVDVTGTAPIAAIELVALPQQ